MPAVHLPVALRRIENASMTVVKAASAWVMSVQTPLATMQHVGSEEEEAAQVANGKWEVPVGS